MGLLDSLKQTGADALHGAADATYDKVLNATGVGPTKPAPTIPQGSSATVTAGPSPLSAESLHFSPSGFVAYIKANPIKGGLAALAILALGFYAFKKLR